MRKAREFENESNESNQNKQILHKDEPAGNLIEHLGALSCWVNEIKISTQPIFTVLLHLLGNKFHSKRCEITKVLCHEHLCYFTEENIDQTSLPGRACPHSLARLSYVVLPTFQCRWKIDLKINEAAKELAKLLPTIYEHL